MKELLKNQAGAVIIVVILVLVLAVAGGGAAFLAVRMVVAGDGNFLQPFEELGWIEPKEDDSSKNSSEEKDTDKEKDVDETEDDETTTSENKEDYLIDDKRLSSEAQNSDVEHYYGEISLSESMDGEDEEYAELYKLIKAGVNLYAQDGKVIEIAFGFDITEFCEEAYSQYSADFEGADIHSAEDLQEMMMSMLETMFDSFDEYSEYISKYIDGGKLQLYVTEKGFESLYETYEIEDGENDVETLINSIESSFSTEIKLVK